jgi:hypothetical protein
MGFIGSLPPVTKPGGVANSDIASAVDSTAQSTAGQIAFFKDSSDRWSVVRYYKAAATIGQGDGLVKDTVARDPNQLKKAATGDAFSPYCKGVAAASVNNTGYFSWSYIGGYCPNVGYNSGYASNQLFGLSGTTAAKFSSHGQFAFNTGTATGLATGTNFPVVWSLGAESTATSATDVFALNSGVIIGWLL